MGIELRAPLPPSCMRMRCSTASSRRPACAVYGRARKQTEWEGLPLSASGALGAGPRASNSAPMALVEHCGCDELLPCVLRAAVGLRDMRLAMAGASALVAQAAGRRWQTYSGCATCPYRSRIQYEVLSFEWGAPEAFRLLPCRSVKP